MNKKLFKTVLVAIMTALSTISCSENEVGTSKTSGFESPEEYLKSTVISNAIKNSGIKIYQGKTPPSLIGGYAIEADIVAVSAAVKDMYARQIKSNIVFFDQTPTGRIEFQENGQSTPSYGSGGYITGSWKNFTFYGEEYLSGVKDGLPEGVSARGVVILSGSKEEIGDIEVLQGITVITEMNGNAKFKCLEGAWWGWSGIGTLNGVIVSSSFKTPVLRSMHCGISKTLLDTKVTK
jgi:hypothetical protein